MKNISIHFTTKNQTIELIKEIFMKNENLFNNNSTVLSHCFLNRVTVNKMKFSTELIDFIETIPHKKEIRWFDNFKNLKENRVRMIDYIKETDGTCFFVGDIIEGVKEEFDYAKAKKCNIIKI